MTLRRSAGVLSVLARKRQFGAMSSFTPNKEGQQSTALFYYLRKDKKVNNGTQSSRSRSTEAPKRPTAEGQVQWTQLHLSFLQPNERTEAHNQRDDGDPWGLLRLSFDVDDAWHVFEFEIPSELGELLLNYTRDRRRLAVTTSIELLALRLGNNLQDDDVCTGQSLLRVSRLFGRRD